MNSVYSSVGTRVEGLVKHKPNARARVSVMVKVMVRVSDDPTDLILTFHFDRPLHLREIRE